MTNYKKFGLDIYKHLDDKGWNSLSKKDLVVSLIHFAIENKLLPENDVYQIAQKTRINPSSVRRILEERKLIMNEIEVWSVAHLIDWMQNSNQTTKLDDNKGCAVFAINDPSEKFNIENLLSKIGLVPDYKNNRNLLVLDIQKIIVQISNTTKFDPVEFLKSFITINNLKNEEYDIVKTKADFNGVISEILKEQIEGKIGSKTTNGIISILKTIHHEFNKN